MRLAQTKGMLPDDGGGDDDDGDDDNGDGDDDDNGDDRNSPVGPATAKKWIDRGLKSINDVRAVGGISKNKRVTWGTYSAHVDFLNLDNKNIR